MIEPEYTVLETKTYFQYFCRKLSCFQVWYSENADDGMKCPVCGESEDVVYRK